MQKMKPQAFLAVSQKNLLKFSAMTFEGIDFEVAVDVTPPTLAVAAAVVAAAALVGNIAAFHGL